MADGAGRAGATPKGGSNRKEQSKSFGCFSFGSRVLCRLLQGSEFTIRGCPMPKYLIQASYLPEGARGLVSEGGSKRRDAATKAIKAAGGKVEAFYFAFGASMTPISWWICRTT